VHHQKPAIFTDYVPVDEWKIDEDVQKMTWRYNHEFTNRFLMAFCNYEAGEWEVNHLFSVDRLNVCSSSRDTEVVETTME